MQLSVVGRHVEVTEEIKDYAQQKAERLPRYYDRVQNVEIVLDRESDMVSVEMLVTAASKQTFVAKEVGPDVLACIDLLVDKMERQLTKHKEKFRNRKHLGTKAGMIVEQPDEDVED